MQDPSFSQSRPRLVFPGYFEPLTAPDPLHAITANLPAGFRQKRGDPPVAIAPILRGKSNDLGRWPYSFASRVADRQSGRRGVRITRTSPGYPGPPAGALSPIKRHILTDTTGLLVGAIVHEASVQDRDGAAALLASIRRLYPWLRHVFTDAAYSGDKLAAALSRLLNCTIEIVRRLEASGGLFLACHQLNHRRRQSTQQAGSTD